jgi:Uma2 family endonuclease
MTLSEFLAWEERQELRYEFDGVEPVAMTSGTAGHEIIGAALRRLLYEELRGTGCPVWGPNSKIEVAGRIRYPDAFVACAPVSLGETIVPDPVVVFEVLSTGTGRTDRIEKLREYQATPSIRRYIILEQESVAASVFRREGPDWVAQVAIAGDILDMPEIGIAVPLDAIYADLPGDALDATRGS